jgi:hypothetical protein
VDDDARALDRADKADAWLEVEREDDRELLRLYRREAPEPHPLESLSLFDRRDW